MIPALAEPPFYQDISFLDLQLLKIIPHEPAATFCNPRCYWELFLSTTEDVIGIMYKGFCWFAVSLSEFTIKEFL